MYIFENALKNLGRNLGRNIMIGAIIFAIILTTVVALVINNTATAVITDYQGRFSSEIRITPNMQRVREEARNNSADGRMMLRMPQIPSELYLEFAESEHLSKTVMSASLGANSSSIRAIDQSDEPSIRTQGGGVRGGLGGQLVQQVRRFAGNFRLLGDSWKEFDDGTRALLNGNFPVAENRNEIMISEDLATANAVDVGDIVTFTVNFMRPLPGELDANTLKSGEKVELDGMEYTVDENLNLTREVNLELAVVGIYSDLTDEYANENLPKIAALNRRNEILTTLPTLLAAKNENETGLQIAATFYLKDSALLAAFEAEVRAKGLPETFDVGTDGTFDSIVRPVQGLKSISLTFMMVVLILGGIILALLTSISIRERKYEIGVLRAMGLKKHKVALGLWTEIIIITLVCLVVGLGLGVMIAQPISDALLEGQVAAVAAVNAQAPLGGGQRPGSGGIFMMGPGGLMAGATNATPLSEMEVTLDFRTLLQIIGISIALASVAGLVSLSRITKYEPIKILMERN